WGWFGSAWARVHACWTALWRHASHVPASADHTRRTNRARIVVRSSVFDVRPSESFAGEPHRLGLVHGIAGCIRHCGRHRSRIAVAHADARELVVRPARGN